MPTVEQLKAMVEGVARMSEKHGFPTMPKKKRKKKKKINNKVEENKNEASRGM